jgi:hypothetical protein
MSSVPGKRSDFGFSVPIDYLIIGRWDSVAVRRDENFFHQAVRVTGNPMHVTWRHKSRIPNKRSYGSEGELLHVFRQGNHNTAECCLSRTSVTGGRQYRSVAKVVISALSDRGTVRALP